MIEEKIFYRDNGILLRKERQINGVLSDKEFPAITEYTEEGFIWKETWMIDGIISRSGDLPAVVTYCILDADEILVIEEEYYINGKIGRANNLPARIEYDENNGWVLLEEYLVDEKYFRENDLPTRIEFYPEKCLYIDGDVTYTPRSIHREYWFTSDDSRDESFLSRLGDKPAIIEYNGGFVFTQKYYIDGNISRLNNLPAEIDFFHLSTIVFRERWRVNGIPHRNLNQPIEIIYYPNGKIKEFRHNRRTPPIIQFSEEGKISARIWCDIEKLFDEDAIEDGDEVKLHREEHPAVVRYGSDGQIVGGEWWINGIRLGERFST